MKEHGDYFHQLNAQILNTSTKRSREPQIIVSSGSLPLMPLTSLTSQPASEMRRTHATRSKTNPPTVEAQPVVSVAASVSTRPRRATRPCQALQIDDDQSQSRPAVKYPRTGKRGAPQAFPRKLFEILCREPGDVIGWSSLGSSSFVIKDMDKFVTYILEKYFRHQKYSSFQRQLNLYGFRKVSKGSDAGAYSHKYFVDGRSDLLSKVRRMPQSAAALGSAKASGKSAVIIEGGRHSESPTTLDSEDMSEEEELEDKNGDEECVEEVSTTCGPLRAVFSNAFASFDFDENTDTAIAGPGRAAADSKVTRASSTPPIPTWSMGATAVASADPLLDQLDLEESPKPVLDFVTSSAPQKATFDGFVFDAHRLTPTPSGPSIGSTAAGFVPCLGGSDKERDGGDSDSEMSCRGESSMSGTITNEPGRPPVAIAVTQSAGLIADLCSVDPDGCEPLKILRAPSPVDAVDAGLSHGICKLTVAPFENFQSSAEPPVRVRSLSISSDDWAIEGAAPSPSADLFNAVESAGMARW